VSTRASNIGGARIALRTHLEQADFGTPGYSGPCPPKGDKPHRYQFTLLAVDMDKLPVDENISGAVVGFNPHFHTLGKAAFTATYGR